MQDSYQFDHDLQQKWTWSEHHTPKPESLRYAKLVAEHVGLLDGTGFERRATTASFAAESLICI